MKRLAVAIGAMLALSHAPTYAQNDTTGPGPDRERIAAALASPSRPLEHRLRDERRTPEHIFDALQLEPGDKVLDIASGGGYLALIAAELVGETGRVDIHNTPGWIAQFPSTDPELMARAINRSNIGFVTEPWNDVTAEAETYDAIVIGQVYHDIILEGADMASMNRSLFDMLKPGGMLVIEDHDADPNMPPGEQVVLHRIAAGIVVENMRLAGFNRVSITTLPSAHDDFRFNVFRPGIRGRTSRYVLGFRKPG